MSSDNDEDLSRSVIARPRVCGHPATPHNTKGVGVHVTSVLEDLDHLSCQGFDVPSPTWQ